MRVEASEARQQVIEDPVKWRFECVRQDQGDERGCAEIPNGCAETSANQQRRGRGQHQHAGANVPDAWQRQKYPLFRTQSADPHVGTDVAAGQIR